MRPLKIEAENYRSYADLEYSFVDGATAVTGQNGSGKSTLIGAVEVALFGPRSRSLEPLVREGSDTMSLTLEFSHGDDIYRVRREWENGRSTLDLELLDESALPERRTWLPLTQGSASDSQALIETTIGMTRSTFAASGFLAQRASDTFTGATPAERKGILSEALGLDQWAQDAKRVGSDRLAAEKTATEVDVRIAALAERAQAADTLASEATELHATVDAETAAANEARGAAETEASRANALDETESRWKVCKAAVGEASARDEAHRRLLVDAQAARENADGVRQDISRLERLCAEKQEIDVRRAALVEQERARAEKVAEAEAVGRERTAETNRGASIVSARTLVEDKLDAIAAEQTPTCDRCRQDLGVEARAAAVASLEQEVATHNRSLAEARERERLLKTAAAAIVIPAAPEGLDDLDRRHQEIATVVSDLAVARERLTTLELTIDKTDNDDYRDTARRLSYEMTEAEQALAAIPPLVPGAADVARAAALQAQTAGHAHDSRANAATARLAAVTALLEQARAAQAEHTSQVAERDRLHTDLDILTALEKAFGRHGVPAWIVESQAIPAIESEANRVLSLLGGAISRVELRTERETKAGDKRDALDVICLTDDGERALETFSGGEQSRAEIALALGLVDVLAARRDADLRFLALDEPSGLDSQGTEALAGILRERAPGTVVMLASHDPALRDAFDASITIERGPSGSRVIA